MQSVRRAWSTGFQRSRAVQRDGRVHRSRAGADVAARGAPVAAQAAREGGEETCHDLFMRGRFDPPDVVTVTGPR